MPARDAALVPAANGPASRSTVLRAAATLADQVGAFRESEARRTLPSNSFRLGVCLSFSLYLSLSVCFSVCCPIQTSAASFLYPPLSLPLHVANAQTFCARAATPRSAARSTLLLQPAERAFFDLRKLLARIPPCRGSEHARYWNTPHRNDPSTTVQYTRYYYIL